MLYSLEFFFVVSREGLHPFPLSLGCFELFDPPVVLLQLVGPRHGQALVGISHFGVLTLQARHRAVKLGFLLAQVGQVVVPVVPGPFGRVLQNQKQNLF